MDAHLPQVVNLHIHDVVRKTELGDAVFQHTAYLVKGLKHIHVVAVLHHVAGEAQSGRTRTYHGHLDAVEGSYLGNAHIATLTLEVGGKPLQIADGYGGLVHLQMNTAGLALLLLRTDTAADGRQRRGVFQHLRGGQELATLDVLDEGGDVHAYRTAFHAGGLRTVETALGLGQCHLFCQTLIHLLQTGGGTVYWVEFGHHHTGNGGALLRLHLRAEGLAPFGIAVGQYLYGVVGGVVVHHDVGGVYHHFLLTIAQMLLKVLQLLLLGALEGAHALEHLVPVYQTAVELRTVDTHEAGLAADGQTTGTTHAGAVYHDGVQRHVGGDVVFLGEQTAEFHHDGRTDGKYLVDMFLVDELLNADGHHAFFSITAVVGHDDGLVAVGTHLVLKDDEVFRTAGEHAQHAVASGFQCLDDGEHGSYTNTTSGTDHRTEVLDVGGVAKRTHHVGHIVANVQVAQLDR